MRRAFLALASGLLLAICPQAVEAGGLDLRAGWFFPSANSNLFHDDAELYLLNGDVINKSDWSGFTGGVEVSFGMAPKLDVGFSVDAYQRTLHTSSRDFVFEGGREIFQTLKLNIVPVGVSLTFVANDRRGSITPFLTFGGDLFFWRYEEFGDFVDYESLDRSGGFDVFEDFFLSDGVGFGFHVAGGIRFPLNDDWSLVAQGRYQYGKDDMGGDFRGNEIDLSGASATLGLRLTF